MILGVLQARLGSTRLPGKVLKPILGKPMLSLQLQRLGRCRRMDALSVATSADPKDDAIETLCREMQVPCFRGSEEDVLDRVYRAARVYGPRHVVRLTGDCPLTDPAVVDEVIAEHLAGDYDYTSNCRVLTFPDGLDAEVMRFTCLEEAWREARLPSHREHVTPFLHQQPDRYELGSVTAEADYSYYRWVVDRAEDLELVNSVYRALYPRDPHFTWRDVLALVEEKPELAELNAGIPRDEGWSRSLEEDARFSEGIGPQ